MRGNFFIEEFQLINAEDSIEWKKITLLQLLIKCQSRQWSSEAAKKIHKVKSRWEIWKWMDLADNTWTQWLISMTQERPPDKMSLLCIGNTQIHIWGTVAKIPEFDQASKSTYQFKRNRRGQWNIINNTGGIQSPKSRMQTPQDKRYNFLNKSIRRLKKETFFRLKET